MPVEVAKMKSICHLGFFMLLRQEVSVRFFFFQKKDIFMDFVLRNKL